MMKLLSTILSIFLFSLTFAQDGIDFFHGTFDEAKAQAKEEGKLIFMDAFTTWCGPCKRMAASVFPDKEVGEFFNRNFINLKMDMEKGEGPTLRRTYKVSAYPTLLFIDYTGSVVYETKGARDANGLIALGQKALLPNGKMSAEIQTKWEEGNREPAFLKEYINVQSAIGNNYDEAMEAYLAAIPYEDQISTSNSQFILSRANHIASPATKFFIENKSYFIDTYGQEDFDEKIDRITQGSIRTATKKKDADAMAEVINFMNTVKPSNYKEKAMLMETTFYGKTGDWANYDKVATKYLKKYKSDDDKALREVAWNYYMKMESESQWKKAEKWAASAVALNNTYENNLTQAYLLYKLKKYSDAQDAVEYALILAGQSQKKTKNAEILKEQIYKKLEESK